MKFHHPSQNQLTRDPTSGFFFLIETFQIFIDSGSLILFFFSHPVEQISTSSVSTTEHYFVVHVVLSDPIFHSPRSKDEPQPFCTPYKFHFILLLVSQQDTDTARLTGRMMRCWTRMDGNHGGAAVNHDHYNIIWKRVVNIHSPST